jgi:hypothetical protein
MTQLACPPIITPTNLPYMGLFLLREILTLLALVLASLPKCTIEFDVSPGQSTFCAGT